MKRFFGLCFIAASILCVSHSWAAQQPTVGTITGGSYQVSYTITGSWGYLEERQGTSGAWTNVSYGVVGNNSHSVMGKAPGTYQYRVVDYFIEYSEIEPLEIPTWSTVLTVSVTNSGPPITLDSPLVQSQYTWQARRGDINADGRLDLYVKRLSGNPDNGVFHETIATQGAAGNFELIAATGSQLAVARNWSTISVSFRSSDFSADGYVDAITTNLPTYFSGVDDQIISSPGVQYSRQAIGIAPWNDQTEMRVDDFFNATQDDTYFDSAMAGSQPGYNIQLMIEIGYCYLIWGFPVCAGAASTVNIGDFTLAELGLTSSINTTQEEKTVRLNSEPEIQAQQGFSYNETLTCVVWCGYYIYYAWNGYEYVAWYDIWTPITIEGAFDTQNYSEEAFDTYQIYLNTAAAAEVPMGETAAEEAARKAAEKAALKELLRKLGIWIGIIIEAGEIIEDVQEGIPTEEARRRVLIILEQMCEKAKREAETDPTVDWPAVCDAVLEDIIQGSRNTANPDVYDEDEMAEHSVLVAVILERLKDPTRWNCTYSATHSQHPPYYGRTSARQNENCNTARQRRWNAHVALRSLGFVQHPDRDATGITGYGAIRGREQQLIDSHIWTDGVQDPIAEGAVVNRIRGVAKKNPLGCVFWLASSAMWTPIGPYTGTNPSTCVN